MNILIAIDSFKGSVSSMEAGLAIKRGILRACPDTNIFVRPLADGGEGTIDALVRSLGGSIQTINGTGPLGELRQTEYGIIPRNHTAIIEMSKAAGLTLVPPEKRNPLFTTTYGVGEVIRDAIQKGCRKFIIGIGGSATNDGGVGMLQSLGFQFLNSSGNSIPVGARGLEELAEIRTEQALPELHECTFEIACDVSNPLCGMNGCSVIFGPQKGATPDMVFHMDEWLKNYASLSEMQFPHANPNFPGAGAAGGLGFAFHTFLHATLKSGIDIILDELQLEMAVKISDLIITGEGRMDAQTAMGKAPMGIARLAKHYHKPVIAFTGTATKDAYTSLKPSIDAIFPISEHMPSLEEAMKPEKTKENLATTAEIFFRVLNAAGKL